MVRQRPVLVLKGLVCMTDFLFAVIAGLLFLAIASILELGQSRSVASTLASAKDIADQNLELQAAIGRVEKTRDQSEDRLLAFKEELEQDQTLRAAANALRKDIAALKKFIQQKQAEVAQLRKVVDEGKVAAAKAQELHQELDRLKKQIAKAQDRIKQLQRKLDTSGNPLFGSYTGPHVLIECDKDGVSVYRSDNWKKTPMGLPSSTRDREWLLKEIDRLGFVAFLVRPGGFDKSFDDYTEFIYDHIDRANQTRPANARIGDYSFPAEADEPIEKYRVKTN
jgi:hypothetical protein